jgi:hypothetical protein
MATSSSRPIGHDARTKKLRAGSASMLIQQSNKDSVEWAPGKAKSSQPRNPRKTDRNLIRSTAESHVGTTPSPVKEETGGL